MIAEAGLALLWMAAALALVQLIAALVGLRGISADLGASVRPIAMLQGPVVAASFVALVLLFLRTDLSVALVAKNSHVDKPWIYKLAGTWGNHEGSMLLWVMVMALSGAFVAKFARQLGEDTMQATLAAQALVSLGFYAFLLAASNPFARLDPPARGGLGLNPLLQDIGLAFHPPTLYLGYVGLSVAFSFAVGALVTGNVGPAFAKAMRPWVLAAWIFLTLGITAGSYWAYYELGWGGWWFWDPVENASLMPWLAATALLHSVNVLASRDALRVWTVMLAVIAFSMSMVGTFLVRSGILTSVHAFAVDPTRGGFILVLLALYIGGALLLFALRAGAISEGQRFSPISREAALVLNNVALTAILGIVLFGTLYPLFTEAFGQRVSVGPPYFDPFGALFFVPMVIVMAVGPLLRWRDDSIGRSRAKLLVPLAVSVATGLAVMLLAPEAGLLPTLGLTLASGLAVASVLPLLGRKLLRTPLTLWGMVVAHLGLAVSLGGVASDSAFTVERLAALPVGGKTSVGPWHVELRDVVPVAGPNWTALEADLRVAVDGRAAVPLRPQARSFFSPPTATTESALLTRWNGQLYAVLGDRADGDRWQLRLWWKPFVTLIWLGGVLIALGGALALAGRIRHAWRRRNAEDAIAWRRMRMGR